MGTLTLMQFWFQPAPCLFFFGKDSRIRLVGVLFSVRIVGECWKIINLSFWTAGFPQLSCVGSVPRPTVWSTKNDKISLEAFAVPAARDTEIEDEEALFFFWWKKQLSAEK